MHGRAQTGGSLHLASVLRGAHQWLQSQAGDHNVQGLDGPPGRMLILLCAAIFAALCLFLLVPRFM